MRKYILTFLLLCLHGLARGQTEGYSCYYWFDDDLASLHSVTSPTDSWQMMADASGLSESLHTIHIMVRDSAGRQSLPKTQLFMHTAKLSEQSKAYYWFDNQTGKPQTSPMLQGSFDVDASTLTDGFHSFHYVVALDEGGIFTPIVTYFVKVPMVDDRMKGFYWFDEETNIHEAPVAYGTFEVDATSLSDGFHRFHYQAVNNNGTASASTTSFFLKTAQVSEGDMLNCICSVDGQLRHIEKLPIQGGIIHWNLDMKDLTDGLHRIQLQAVTPSGAMCSSYTSYFMRVTTTEELGDMRCVYAIDDDAFNTDATVMGSNGKYHFDLDMSELSDGLHHISYMLYNDRGTNTKIQTRFFIKMPLGGNAIGQYQYWLNDDDINEAKTVTLPQKVNPLQLMSLLPVESRPLRSSLFQFDTSSGQPKVYAKNTIHLRFYDAAMRFTDAVKDYADYSVSQDVNVIKELESGVRETTEWPEENEIKWYQVTAERGDSLSFKTDIATTLQLFSPSGKEVYSASGSEVVKWGGCHAPETGTFYLALHDVTATQGDNISIDYEHIDRYAVLRQDVTVVGNGGCSTITFEGNGFRDLYAVDLYNEQGDTIKHILIGHESNTTTSVTFDFTGVALGEYHAKFHFTEDDKVFLNLVTVEEAVDIELATTVTYPSSFLRGTSTTYTIKITNKGNMTAYCLPLELRLRVTSMQDVSEIRFSDNLEGFCIPREIYADSIDEDVSSILTETLAKYSDIVQFVFYKDSLENIDYGLSQLFLNIRPNTTEVFTITIESSSFVFLTASVTKEWIPFTTKDMAYTKAMRIKHKSAGEWMCCNRRKIECVADIAANIIGNVLPPGANCATSFAVTGLEAIYDILCSEGNTTKEKFKNYIVSEGKTLARKLLTSAISCVTGYFTKHLNDLKRKRELALNNGNLAAYNNYTWEIGNAKTIFKHALSELGKGLVAIFIGDDCVTAWTQPVPNCPPNPGGGGGSSTPVNSLDPNDIYGYIAESGSKTIKDSQNEVYYTIEFENDPAFATASAHEIFVTDTLDATKFDLSTFAPTRVMIGEKSVELKGDKNFVTTIDMRPEINAIAQVEGTFDQKKGIAKWHVSSFDPMTMEPTDDVMQGVLPVNHNGNGMGEVMFDISLKPGLVHGTEVKNRAGIVFDQNDVIMTPTWVNTIDRIAPESHVTDVKRLNDSIASVSIEATDELSGPWCYDVYVQYGQGSAWFKAAENVRIDTTASVRIYEGIDHGFYVVVTDSAGNVEQKEAVREYTLDLFGPQNDTNTKLELAQGWNWISQNQNEALSVEALKPNALRIVGQTEETIKDANFGYVGNLDELLPTQMYKVQMAGATDVQLGGKLFYAAFKPVPLYRGWNWIGYPMAHTMAPGEALAIAESEEGELLIGQDGMAVYSDGQWTGTLTEMVPGQGFMYRSASDKNLFYNAMAQASSRRVNAPLGPQGRLPEQECLMHDAPLLDDWTVDKHRYPNVMGLIAQLWIDQTLADAGDWILGAFSADECRGIAMAIDGNGTSEAVLMMNVYGSGGEPITFCVVNRETGEVLQAIEQEPFRADVVGTMSQPYALHIGTVTGVQTAAADARHAAVYDLQGRRVDGLQAGKGIYVVSGGKRSRAQKIVKK